jgi:outer membrane protein TolC
MLEAAMQEREGASRMLRARLETLLSRGRDAGRRATLFQDKQLPKARQSHEAVEASYRAGRASLLDVFDSRRRLLETETGYWRALADQHSNQAEIDALFVTEIQAENDRRR